MKNKVTTELYISFRSLVRGIIPAIKIKMDLYLAAFLCFKALRVAGKGPDRFYAWPVPLVHLKRCFSGFFS
ncbi:hypothetical protein BK781_11165 [Bacillus thuringiensis serovar aizawai]|nr:hypothetical protein BK781_11165 [Bacillus thuringiensis serovar aizawai]